MLADLELPDKGKVVCELDGDWVDISIAGYAAYGCKKKIRFYVSGICLKLLFNCFKPVSYPFREL